MGQRLARRSTSRASQEGTTASSLRSNNSNNSNDARSCCSYRLSAKEARELSSATSKTLEKHLPQRGGPLDISDVHSAVVEDLFSPTMINFHLRERLLQELVPPPPSPREGRDDDGNDLKLGLHLHYQDALNKMYSMLLRPTRSPVPTRSRNTVLEILFLSLGEGSSPNFDGLLSQCFFSFWGGAFAAAAASSVAALFVRASIILTIFHHFLTSAEEVAGQLKNAWIAAQSNSADGDECSTLLGTFLKFVDVNLPSLHVALSQFFPLPLLGGTRNCQPNDAASAIASSSSSPSPLPALLTLAQLTMSDTYDDVWHVLFDTNSDGGSFNRYRSKLEGYDQPTFSVLELNSDPISTIGVYTTATYKSQADYTDSSSTSFLFSDHPYFKALRVNSMCRDQHHLYLNPSSRSKNLDGLPHGVGWGGYSSQGEMGFRIFLSEDDFMTVRCSPGTEHDCRTFQAGPLLSSSCLGTAEVLRLRVYGTRDVSLGLSSLAEEATRRGEAIMKARKVDRAAFLDDFRSGVLESKAFAHTGQVDKGRAGDDCT